MIDIHNHILPGVDDGASDMYETLEMVRLAEESGVTAIVATPHCNITGGEENYYSEEYVNTIQRVREIVKEEGFSVEILPALQYATVPLALTTLAQSPLIPVQIALWPKYRLPTLLEEVVGLA